MGSHENLGAALVVVLLIVLIAAAAWYWTARYGTLVVRAKGAAGAVFATRCPPSRIRVVHAALRGASGGGGRDVTAALAAALRAQGPALDAQHRARGAFAVSWDALGAPAGGELVCRFRCAAAKAGREGFEPAVEPPCGPRFLDAERAMAEDPTCRNAAGTVALVPFSEETRISLARGAQTPQAADYGGGVDPITFLGSSAAVQVYGDRYRAKDIGGADCAGAPRRFPFGLSPGDPGSMVPFEEDGQMSQLLHTAAAYQALTGFPATGPRGPRSQAGLGCSPAGCGYDIGLPAAYVENPEFLNSGPYGAIAALDGPATRA